MCKQLNEPVIKSLKPNCLGRNRKKKLAGPGRTRAQILFQARPGLDCSHAGWAGTRLKNLARADL